MLLSAGLVCTSSAQPFQLPTENRAPLQAGAEEQAFAGTAGKSWESGTFGCVRSGRAQMHEGLDIRCLKRDRRGEPKDEVWATAPGTVVYINTRPALSNYGKYVIIRHVVDGVELFSLYAHLSQFAPGLKPGKQVNGGEIIAVMGRTANTKEGISKDRAHVHFELNLMANERFPSWYKDRFPGERNDHGLWNGQNLLGIDARQVLLEQQTQGAKFNLMQFIARQPELCRITVLKKQFPWLKRYAALVRMNAIAEKEGIAGYELALNFNGIPIELIPRAASELNQKSGYHLVSVNEAEYHKNPCRHLVAKKSHGGWELTQHGRDLLDLLLD